ncbi:MAG: ATP-binding cassette subfamily C protein LapB [Desulforhopalus sp.]|jgi:ATP-binding cassette subfamily C protein LapB
MIRKIVRKKKNTWDSGHDSDVYDDPLTDCLVILSKVYGTPVSRTTLRAGLPLVDNQLTVKLVQRAARRAGLTARVLKRPLSKISDLELPCILLLNDKKAVVLRHFTDGGSKLQLNLPESGEGVKTVPLEEITKDYSGYAIFVHPEFKEGLASISRKIPHRRKFFWGAIFSSWRIYRDVLLASFLINIFGLATPFFVLNVYDRVIPNSAFETLWVLAIGIAIAYLFSLLMQGLRGYFIDEAGKKANLEVSSRMFEKVLGLKMAYGPQSTGSFSNKILQFEHVRDFITSFSITAIVDLPFVVLALFVIWYLAGNVVLIHLTAILILLIYTLIVQRPLRKAVEQTYHASARKNAILVEGLGGLETLKILGAEGKIQNTWEEAVSYISHWSSRARFLSTSVTHLAAFVQNVTVVVVVVAGVYIIDAGSMSQGGLIAIVILSRQAVAPMAQVVSLMTRYHRAKTALDSLEEVMNLPVERPLNKTFLHRADLTGAIEFKNVNFTYPEQSLAALKDISVKISPGEKVGIIGGIGSGKTTFGKMILGLYEPDSGMVALDGTDLRQIDPLELRRFIGCVPQDVVLFRGSVKDNILLGCDVADDADVLRAAKISGLTEFTSRHALGYDMQVGERGKLLSGGQRQTVAIARALLLDPQVLIFDEPTSSMDAKTEAILRKRLHPILGNKTLIVITHRVSLLNLVDRVILLDDGGIRADGPRESILEALKSGQLNL